MRHGCTVILTFDFDAEALWEGAYGITNPSVLSRGTYGARAGVPRILTILQRHDIPATFFVPGITAERHPDIVRRVHEAGHEIGHHGYLHVSPVTQTIDEERAALEKGLEILEGLTGERPVGYRSPSWDLSDHSLELLAMHGFLYDSSLMDRDEPYLIPGSHGPLVEIPICWELDDAPYFLFAFRPIYRVGLADPDRVLSIWRTEFDCAYAEGGTVCYTMHPQLIGRRHRLRMLEELIRHIRQFPGVRFCRASDAARGHLSQASRTP
jgi:peptidoglycan/xylan/chitin deacetylase (PgdA/CDA1 family)